MAWFFTLINDYELIVEQNGSQTIYRVEKKAEKKKQNGVA